jgi:carbonic anhydrase
MIAAEEALQRLKEGNAHFASGDVNHDAQHCRVRREQLVTGQDPIAIVVGCSDSRVPVEIVFDQWLGGLFVIRIAGNVISKTQLGSIEFAATRFGVRLVVVMGHTGCGAVEAAFATVQQGVEPRSDNLRLLVDTIRPSVGRVLERDAGRDKDALLDLVGRENVRRSVGVIRNSPGILQRLIEEEGLMVRGAEYSLKTGVVEFF